jgi:GMP synthase-like glutamine amidotransferase
MMRLLDAYLFVMCIKAYIEYLFICYGIQKIAHKMKSYVTIDK